MTALVLGVLAARALLAAVFLMAGISKLLDRQGSRRALADFGIPEPLAGWLHVALPVAECAVAVALFPRASSSPASVGALSLLALFSIGIGTNLAQGRKPDCHCFGQIYSALAATVCP